MDYNEIFEELITFPSNGSKYQTRQVEFDKSTACKFKIKLAVDKDDDNRKCVVLQLNNGGKKADSIINNINTLNNFRIDVYPAASDEIPDVNYIIKLQHETEEGIFTKFVDDLVSVVRLSANELIVLDVLKRVKAWMNFFKGKSTGLLTENSQLGLYAELSALRSLLLLNKSNALAVVLGWEGPNKQNQDFIFPNGAGIEVKCTSKNNNKQVSISNELQLDDKGLKKLFLAVYQVKRHKLHLGAAFESLPNIVDEIKDLIKNDSEAKLEFDGLLIKIGYLEEFEAEYLNYGFQLLEGPDFYMIDNDFPRIIRSNDLPNGITQVRYKVNLQEQSVLEQDVYKSIEF